MTGGRTEVFSGVWEKSGLFSENQKTEGQAGPCGAWQRGVGAWRSGAQVGRHGVGLGAL